MKPPFKTALEEADAIHNRIDMWRDRIDWLTAKEGPMKPYELTEVIKLSSLVSHAYEAEAAIRLLANSPKL